MEEKVSVIIPTQNRSRMLVQAVKSVLKQTWGNLEVIIVDDASNDDTPDVMAHFAETDGRIEIVRLSNARGGAAARNEGLRRATGTWVAFLDDDDSWEPDKIKCQITVMRQTEGASAATCQYVVHNQGSHRHASMPDNPSLVEILKENNLGGASVCLARRETLSVIGGFDEGLTSGQDWDLWVKLRILGRIANCRIPLVNYYEHHGERITTRMEKKYSARRRFFFRYRKLMDRYLRRFHLAWAKYYRSRNPNFTRKDRKKSLKLAVVLALRLGEISLALSFIKNGLPSLFFNRS